MNTTLFISIFKTLLIIGESRLDILRGCAEILFRKIPYDIASLDVSKEIFCQFSPAVFSQYSDDEIEYIFEYLNQNKNPEQFKNLSVFNVVFKIADEILSIDKGQVTCEYHQVLRWRDISFKLGQDIFVTATLAKDDILNNKKTNQFTWSSVIKVKSEELNKMLDQGVAENHFHLNGSSQIFPLSFSCVMNNIENRQTHFEKIKHYLNPNHEYRSHIFTKKTLYSQCMIAAAIRLYLFCKIEKKLFLIVVI